MLLKINCVAVLLVLADGGERRRDAGGFPGGGEDSYDHYESYHADDSDDFDSVRVKRFQSKPTVKTLSPREIQEVRGAINQILSGNNLDNPFTPLPQIQSSNEKRSISHEQVIHKPRRVAPAHESYVYNVVTKFSDNTDVTDNIVPETRTHTTEPISTDYPSNNPTSLATDENYDTELADDFIGATTNTVSSLPNIITNTDDIIKIGQKTIIDEIVTDNDITEKTTEIINYETETNAGLTGATTNALTMTMFTPFDNIDTRDDIKSEINNILGFNNAINNITSIRHGLADINKNNLAGAITNNLPTRSQRPGLLRTESITTIEQDAYLTPSQFQNAATVQNDLEPEHPTSDDAEKDSKEENVDDEKEDDVDKKKPEGVSELNANEEGTPPQLGTQQSQHPDMTIYHPGTGPESVTEVAAIEEAEHEKGEEEKYPEPTKQQGNKPPTRSKPVPSKGQSSKSVPSKNIFSRPTRKTSTTTTTLSTTTTTRTTTTKFQLDVPALLAIIANLTYDYEMNLTDNLNSTLLKYSIPTCGTPTTTQPRGIFVDYEANATGTIVAKCFVCGLEVGNIPRSAHCADAFAGDFLPLVPVDMTARGKISKYRKYCRFADVPHYLMNETQPRSVFGRWTGGCSVRWIDLSGVYTQRSCRNRERAIMGRHFASKRMAKLEMALSNVENGCIASPMATLVPLSRGISLYARFHACVCTGSWCNAADLRVPWSPPWTGPWSPGVLPLLMAYMNTHRMI